MLKLTPGQLTKKNIVDIFHQHLPLQLAPKYFRAIERSQQVLQKKIQNHEIIYGVNTGFGSLANKIIEEKELTHLQENLLNSHAAGVGAYADDVIVRLTLLFKINSLARGFSGIRPNLCRWLIKLYNLEIYPCIPLQGSVGASGDLAPLAHLSLPTLGKSQVRYQEKIYPTQKIFSKLKLNPLSLAPKEGLALINGLQFSASLAWYAYIHLEKLFYSAIIAGSLSLAAIQGNRDAFDQKLQELRDLPAQQICAAYYRNLLGKKPWHTERIQDPYSFRCQPQVMGACLYQMQQALAILISEANAVSDNPLIFSDEEIIIKGGNFHGQALSFACDNLALAIAEIGALSERRIATLMDPHFSHLPAFLTASPGLQSGLMLGQVSAASLVSDNKLLAMPHSIDNIPTSANQEDHVSMSTNAARRLIKMTENLNAIIAIELISAIQALNLQSQLPQKILSSTLFIIFKDLQKHIPFYKDDRPLSEVIAKTQSWLKAHAHAL